MNNPAGIRQPFRWIAVHKDWRLVKEVFSRSYLKTSPDHRRSSVFHSKSKEEDTARTICAAKLGRQGAAIPDHLNPKDFRNYRKHDQSS